MTGHEAVPSSGLGRHPEKQPPLRTVPADRRRRRVVFLHSCGPGPAAGGNPARQRLRAGDPESGQLCAVGVFSAAAVLHPFLSDPPPEPGVCSVQRPGHGQGGHFPHSLLGVSAVRRPVPAGGPGPGRGAEQAGGAGPYAGHGPGGGHDLSGVCGGPADGPGPVRGHLPADPAVRSAAGPPLHRHPAHAQRGGGGEASPGQLGPGAAGRSAAGGGLLPGCVHPGASDGPDLVLRRRADGHRRHLSAVYLRLRDPMPPAAKESPVLLPEAAFRVRFLPGLPHEAQRRRPGLHLHPGHHSAGDALLHHLPVFRGGGFPPYPLSPGGERYRLVHGPGGPVPGPLRPARRRRHCRPQPWRADAGPAGVPFLLLGADCPQRRPAGRRRQHQ